MTYDVFISYASNDRTIADVVCSWLEDKKVHCWIAPRNIQASDDWTDAITRAVKGARVLIVIYSRHCNSSVHVPREINLALQCGLAILPFRIENHPLSNSLEYLLSTVHWMDALTPPLERHIDRLVNSVLSILKTRTKSDSEYVTTSTSFDDWVSGLNLKRRFEHDRYSTSEHCNYDNWRLRFVAERSVFKGIGYEVLAFSEIQQFNTDRLKAFTVSCGDFSIERFNCNKKRWAAKLARTMICAAIAVVNGLDETTEQRLKEEPLYSFKLAESMLTVFVIPAAYDVLFRRTITTSKWCIR